MIHENWNRVLWDPVLPLVPVPIVAFAFALALVSTVPGSMSPVTAATSPPRAQVVASPESGPIRGSKEAHRAILEDRLEEARTFIREGLEGRPDDPDLLILQSLIQIVCLDLAGARKSLDRAARMAPDSAEVRLRRGDLETAAGSLARAQSAYRLALESRRDDSLVLLNLAACLAQEQRILDARRYRDRALATGNLDQEAWLVLAYVEIFLGEDARCSAAVGVYEKKYGPCASTRYLRCLIALKLGALDEARLYLKEAGDRGWENPSFVMQVASLQVTLGQVGPALDLLARTARRHPRSGQIKDQLRRAQRRLSSERSLHHRESTPFVIEHTAGLRRGLVDRIIDLSHRQLAELSSRLGRSPASISMRVLSATGFPSPAYYNNLTGEIIISADFFRTASRGSGPVASHALAHELAHALIWSGRKRASRSVNSLWIDEGLAEALSGGVEYLKESRVDVPGLFRDGTLAPADLAASLNVLGRVRGSAMKAYVQSYFMVAYLLELHPGPDGLSRCLALLDRVASDTPLSDALGSTMGLTTGGFETGWKRHLERNLERR